ncbi:hypothetical protein [Streptomyces sp. WAC06614]|uniref:hypothetical protein n=1 Tax=Streptomyces sp. WAC06614 TaxID=2487416 RepID=UPI000F771B72|nr:hypothetical protein [Streptomyces sp. WAC06614]RSS60385.1 hypothetical protein EF918_33045 [Streptomyces sp. WAC06614]
MKGWRADAAWWDRQVYGADPDDPDPGPVPSHDYVELVGGPLDGGRLLDVTGWSPLERADGVLLMSERGAFGPGGRCAYEPAEIDGVYPSRFGWRGDVP